MGQTSPYILNRQKFLSDLELEHLFYVLTFSTVTNRDRLIIEVALSTGGRAKEILNLRKKDLISESHSVFLRGVKGSESREIPLEPHLFKRLFEHSKTVQGELIFPISYERLKQVWHELRPAQKGFHSLRHTFALNLYRKTRDILLVQRALGHRNINNTLIYARFDFDRSELNRIILGAVRRPLNFRAKMPKNRA